MGDDKSELLDFYAGSQVREFPDAEETVRVSYQDFLAIRRGVAKTDADIARLREAMHTAVLKIQDGAARHAEGVLVAALAESEDSEQEVSDG
jgi:hypothetical protein